LDTATEFVLPSERAGFHKPHPGIFLHALDLVKCGPEETLFVGDNLIADIHGALGAGLSAALFDPRNEKESDLAKPHAPKPTLILRELNGVLEHLGL
jgi:putative hydrolase of the HAD superfamily